MYRTKAVWFCLIGILPLYGVAQTLLGHRNAVPEIVTEQYLKTHLSPKIPRLILTPEIQTNLRLKIKTDPLVKAYYQYLANEAKQILTMPLIEKKLEVFRMPAGIETLRELGILSMVYAANGDKNVLERIDRELLNVCSFSDWNPQHFLDVAHTSLAVSLAIDWTGNALPKKTIQLAKTALIEKGILPSYDEKGVRMGWVNGNNNWNTVCHAAMISASLAIVDINPALAAKTITRALEKMPNSLKEYAPDGVYVEGPGYWSFGTNFAIMASNELTTALGNDFGISASPGLMQSADFRLQATAPSGQFFNYADCDLEATADGAMLLAWFAAKTGDALYLDIPFFKNPEKYRNGTSGDIGRLAGPALIWLSQFRQKKQSNLPLEWYGKGKNPIAIFRSPKEDAAQFYLGMKGGMAYLSHGNMDAGSFVFELNGVRWAIDQGRQEYKVLNKIGFDLANSKQNSERWTLITTSNKGHSTLTVNDAPFKVDGLAPIIHFDIGTKPTATIDMTEVYDGRIASLLRRFTKESNQSFLVEDFYETNEATKNITWTFMTTAEVMPEKNGATLTQEGKKLKLSILSPEDLQVSIISLDPPPFYYDKKTENLKRIEIRLPVHTLKQKKGVISVRLSGE